MTERITLPSEKWGGERKENRTLGTVIPITAVTFASPFRLLEIDRYVSVNT